MTYLSSVAPKTFNADPRGIRLDGDTETLARSYDAVGFRQFEHGKVLVGLLALKPDQRVLDVGCGTGTLGAWVAGQVGPSGAVVGIDPLPLRVALAQRKHARLDAQTGRAEDLSAFADNSFDAVYLNSVLHWIDDQPRALREAWRVLRRGGRIAVNSADAKRPHQSQLLMRRALSDLGMQHVDARSGGSNHLVDADELGMLLRDAGLDDVRTTEYTFVDRMQDVDELINWSISSSFGNWMADFSPDARSRVRARLAELLEPLRSEGSIPLQRHLVFASARKA